MSLLGHWKLVDVVDASGQGNDGEATAVSWVAGKIGNSASFNGSTSGITVPGADFDITAKLTLSWWQYATGTAGYAFAKHNGSKRQYGIYSGYLNWRFYSWNGSPGYIAHSTNFSLSTWQHFTVTVDGTAVLWYLDGDPDGGGTLSGAITTALSDFYMGSRGNGDGGLTGFYTGLLDNVRAYDEVQTAWQVKSIFNLDKGSERYDPWRKTVGGVYTRRAA